MKKENLIRNSHMYAAWISSVHKKPLPITKGAFKFYEKPET